MHAGAGHSSFGGSHASFSAPRSSFASRSAYPSSYGRSAQPGIRSGPGSARYANPYSGRIAATRPTFYSRASSTLNQGSADRRGSYPYSNHYGYNRLGYGYPFFDPFLTSYLNSPWDDGLFDYGDSAPYGDPGPAYTGDSPGGYGYGDNAALGAQPPLGAQPAPVWQSPYAAAPTPYYPQSYTRSSPQAAPEEDAVTLIFKDGRPSEQIRNYALTRTALYITGSRTRQIPLDQIDLPATQRANQAAGVEFKLP